MHITMKTSTWIDDLFVSYMLNVFIEPNRLWHHSLCSAFQSAHKQGLMNKWIALSGYVGKLTHSVIGRPHRSECWLTTRRVTMELTIWKYRQKLYTCCRQRSSKVDISAIASIAPLYHWNGRNYFRSIFKKKSENFFPKIFSFCYLQFV
jgi:hypothetical protein